MGKLNVKEKDKQNDKSSSGWLGALKDAEEGLKKARREVIEWKAVASICRRNASKGAPWPGDRAAGSETATQN